MLIYSKTIPFTTNLLITNIKGPNVLDIGGAECVVRANTFAKSFPRVVMADIAPLPSGLADNVSYVQTPVEKLDAEHGVFEDVVLSNVLEHVDAPKIALRSILNVTEANSRIHILTPNRESLNRRIGLLMGVLSSLEEIPDKEVEIGHKHTFTVASMKHLLEDAGFEITRCQGVFLKPVPTDEMIKWPEERIRAFIDIAPEIPPELCHEVYFQAVPSR